MSKKLVSTVLLILLINLILGEHSNLFGQLISLNDKPETQQLRLNNIERSGLLLDSLTKSETQVLKPISVNDLIPQFLTGVGLSGVAIFTTLIVTVPLFNIKFNVGGGNGNTSSSKDFLFLSVLIAVQVFSTAGSVWMAGSNDKVGGNFGYTLLGTLAGVGLEIGGLALSTSIRRSSNESDGNNTLAWVMSIASLTLPTIGAMVGFNTTRYPKRIKTKQNSLLNFNKSDFTLSNPEIFVDTDKTVKRNPITFIRVASITF